MMRLGLVSGLTVLTLPAGSGAQADPQDAAPPARVRSAPAFDCGSLGFRVEEEQEAPCMLLSDRSVLLPRGVASSGVKYGDGTTTFWTKGDAALLVVDGITHRLCRSLPGNSPWLARSPEDEVPVPSVMGRLTMPGYEGGLAPRLCNKAHLQKASW